MVCDQGELSSNEVMFEQGDHPYDCKAFQFGAPIVGLLFVGGSACISYHMVLFVRSFLCKDCSEAILGCISIQNERFLQIWSD